MFKFSLFESLEQRICFRVEGVDVSVFQGAINWNTLAANDKQFAFVRSSRTTLALDPNFHTNMAGAKAAGVLTGPYHRALPLGDGDAGVYTDPVTDANRFYNAAKDYIKEGYIRPVLDAEDGATLGKTVLSQWWKDFITEFERLSGVEPIIYANTNFATNLIDASLAAEHDLWIARWNGGNANNVDPQTDQPETPGGYPNPYGVWNVPIGGAPSHSSWDFWQYTSNGDGIALGVSSARLDLDVFNGDMEELKQRFVIGYQYAFGGTAPVVGTGATTIQAENFDNGGQGISYNDVDPKINIGGAYRTDEGVDIKPIAGTGGQFRISDAKDGEWLEYTVDVAQAGRYKMEFRVGNRDAGSRFHVESVGAGNLTGSVAVPDTNSFDAFTTVSKVVALPAGKQVLRFVFDDNANNNGYGAALDWMKISAAPTSQELTVETDTAAFVRGGRYASWNWGNNAALAVKNSQSGGENTRETWLKFDLSSVSSISSAKLRLFGSLNASHDPSVNINVYGSNNHWTETGINFNNKPPLGVLRGSFAVSGTTDQTYEIDLTSFLQAAKAGGRDVFSFVLRAANTTDSQAIFASDETGNGPELVINT